MNDDIIYLVHQFVREQGHSAIYGNERPVQKPFSMWAIDEIIFELETSYELPDEIIRRFISLMIIYEDAAEIERKVLFRTARNTAKELYSYLFERGVTLEQN